MYLWISLYLDYNIDSLKITLGDLLVFNLAKCLQNLTTTNSARHAIMSAEANT